MGERAIDPTLFDWPSAAPRLKGARHRASGRISFPAKPDDPAFETVELAPRGALWTYTIQRFLPKSPPYAGPETAETFRPYAVGYIDLPGQVRVEARLTESDPAKLRIGMPMELVIVPFAEKPDGERVMTFAFAPAASASS